MRLQSTSFGVCKGMASELTTQFEAKAPLILELGFRASAMTALKAYLELLWQSNEELNLISRKMTPTDLIENHLIDCLLPLKKFPASIESAKAAGDFGAGGGLPGVIYALQFPTVKYRLYEKSRLKQDFLKKCTSIAPNIEVESEIPVGLIDLDFVTARAFKPIDVILDVSRNYYLNGGRYYLLKGRREKIDEEILIARKKFKDLKVEIEILNSPLLDVERHLVIIS